MRRFLTSALLAAVWVVVPAGSALAVPPSVVIDHVATGYSVQTIDLCGPIDFFQEIVQVQAGGSFAVEAGSQVDMTVTFDQGLEVLPGGNPFTSQVRATLRTSGTISGGFEAFSGVQVEMMGVNVAPGPLAGSGSTVIGAGFAEIGASASLSSVVVDDASTARIDGFRVTYTVPASFPSKFMSPSFLVTVVGDCANPSPLLGIPEPPPDPDSDSDGVPDSVDNCVNSHNPGQENNDGDALGDVCDPDDDNDGTPDVDDAFPFDPTEDTDTDGDGTGNNADTDDDNDGQLDADEVACGSDPLDDGSVSPDFDGDNIPDCVDPDVDSDGVANGDDVCSLTDLADDAAPARQKKNRLWSNAAGMFFYGDGDISEFTVADTGGCSASQVIDMVGFGNGHTKFGISNSAVAAFVASLNGGG